MIEAEAERLYGEILPAIVFVMASIEHLVCYGKRLVAARMGVAAFYAARAYQPVWVAKNGLTEAGRAVLGQLERACARGCPSR